MIDYRSFLTKTEVIVAPVFERGIAWAGTRRLRAPGCLLGWWSFEVRGRQATPKRVATVAEIATELLNCRKIQGHVVLFNDEWRLVTDDYTRGTVLGLPQLVRQPGEVEPAALTVVSAREWPTGELIWETVEFESEAEEQVRQVLEEGGANLRGIKYVPATLRIAWAVAVTAKASRELHIPFSPTELRPYFQELIEGGPIAARRVLGHLAQERAREAARRPPPPSPPPPRIPWQPVVQAHLEKLEDRLELSLSKSRARLISSRRLGEGLVEVRWSFEGERFQTIVEEGTLRVRDAGVCLAGADNMVTLDSLPSVIHEAVETDVLVITRHWSGR